MSAESEVAVAVAYVPGEASVVEGVVTGTAVGAPVPQQSARRVPPSDAEAAAEQPRVSVAESYLYSGQMAKVFTQFDADGDGSISLDELRDMFAFLGLEKAEADGKMSNFDANADGRIALSEWEQGLDSDLRERITQRINEQGKVE